MDIPIEYGSHGISVKLLNVSVTFGYRLGILWIIYVTLEIPSDNKKIALVHGAKNILNKRIQFIFEMETARKTLEYSRRQNVYLIYPKIVENLYSLVCLVAYKKVVIVLIVLFTSLKPYHWQVNDWT